MVLNKSAAAPTAVFDGGVKGALRANSGVEAGRVSAKERLPANCCVSRTGGELEKGVGSFCRSEPGIAAVRRRDDRLRCRQKADANNPHQNVIEL